MNRYKLIQLLSWFDLCIDYSNMFVLKAFRYLTNVSMMFNLLNVLLERNDVRLDL